MSRKVKPRQRFRSLSTSLPDVDGNKGFELPFNCLSSFDPTDEFDENGESKDMAEILEKVAKENESRSPSPPAYTGPLDRFRRLVKAIIVQNRWTSFQNKVADEDQMNRLHLQEDPDNADILTFNPGAFRCNTNAEQILSKEAKLLLCHAPWKRSEKDIKFIYKALDGLTLFKKFSPIIKRELAKSLNFECFEDGRIIIQQGHPGISLYFVVKGSVAVQVATTDKATGNVYKQIVNEIMAGGSFGEMALMSGMNRAATVICIGTSEFLRIDKGDFREVLMRSFQKEWERKTLFMKDCILFKEWTFKEIRGAGAASSIKEYQNNKVIVKDLSTHKGTVYVVMFGTCLVVSKINVIKESLPYGKEYIRMITPEQVKTAPITRYQRKESIFLVIRRLKQGDCFGIGEQLPQTSVISQHKVEVLAVPTIHILRHGRDQSLEKIQAIEIKKYPTLRNAFKNFQTHREWKMYKKDLKDSIIGRKKNK